MMPRQLLVYLWIRAIHHGDWQMVDLLSHLLGPPKNTLTIHRSPLLTKSWSIEGELTCPTTPTPDSNPNTQ